jgi:amino acid transporter
MNDKGQQSVMAVLSIVIASVLSIIIVNAFVDAGNFTGTLSTLADTIPYILIAIGIFAGLGALGLFR